MGLYKNTVYRMSLSHHLLLPTQEAPWGLSGLAATVGFIDYAVAAGFPSPAQEHAHKRLDLNDILIKHPQATFLMRVTGQSMSDAGIDDGDLIIVDRAIQAVHGHVVVAVLDGEFTIKRLWRRNASIKLQAANPTYPDIVPKPGQVLEIWGVVTRAIKDVLA